jgi:putative ubiquitin-RnfH superfamily antitoxin RatB of RatAB toxin-antitoxin module
VLKIEVVYARPDRQARYTLELPEGATVGEAIARSGALVECPEIDLTQNRVGIYGRLVPLAAPLDDGDRVEILRPLVADPKDARSGRAKRSRR